MLVIDGLDECDAASIEAVLQLINNNTSRGSEDGIPISTTSSRCSVKWLVASRREDAIFEHMSEGLQIDLAENSQHVALSVKEYVEVKTADLAKRKRYGQKLQEVVKATLLEKAEGTFLWVSLAYAQLARPGVKAMHTARLLSDFPSGLMPLYRQVLDGILKHAEEVADDDREYVTCILRAMSLALRPLTLFEVGAIADLPDEYRDNLTVLEDFVRLCGALVEIRHGRVHFVHASVKTFLDTVQEVFPAGVDSAHLWMASNCFYSLTSSFDDFYKRKSGLSPGLTSKREIAFLDYAAVFWNHHAHGAPMEFYRELHRGERLCAVDSTFRDRWFAYHWKQLILAGLNVRRKWARC